MSNIDDAITAVADPMRRRILELLSREQLRTNDIAATLEMSVPAISRHLRILRRTGAVHRIDVEGDGRGRRYTLNTDPLETLDRWVQHTSWAQTLSSTNADPSEKLFLTRVGGFLDGFTNNDVTFFEQHLAHDATAIFPNSSATWDAEAIIRSVQGHSPFTRWEIHEITVQTLTSKINLVTIKVDVQTANDPTSTSLVQTMIFDDRTSPWKLRYLQQTTTTAKEILP